MFKPLSAEMKQATEQSTTRLLYFVELHLPNGTVFMHTGIGNIVHDSKTWVGTGHLGSISSVNYSSEAGSNQIEISLSGFDKQLLGEALSTSFVGSDTFLYLAAMDEEFNKPVAVNLLYSGFISDSGITLGSSNNIGLKVSSKLDKWSNGSTQRYSNVQHLQRHTDDVFFKYLAQTATKNIRWGSTTTSSRDGYQR